MANRFFYHHGRSQSYRIGVPLPQPCKSGSKEENINPMRSILSDCYEVCVSGRTSPAMCHRIFNVHGFSMTEVLVTMVLLSIGSSVLVLFVCRLIRRGTPPYVAAQVPISTTITKLTCAISVALCRHVGLEPSATGLDLPVCVHARRAASQHSISKPIPCPSNLRSDVQPASRTSRRRPIQHPANRRM